MNAVDRAVAGREKFVLAILGTAQLLLASPDFVAMLGIAPDAAKAIAAALVPIMAYLTPNSAPEGQKP